jgi:hypothetical protein
MVAGLILIVTGIVQLRRSKTAANPGWLPDPTGRHERRWWDGTTWTADVSDAGVSGNDPLGSLHPSEQLPS